MTTIRQSLYIEFNGINSQEYGIFNVNVSNNSMLEEPLWGQHTIYKTKPRNKRRPFYHNLEGMPLTFTLQLAVQDAWTDYAALQRIKQWLRTDKNYYAPLIFSEMPDKIYYCMATGVPKLVHNANNAGYIEVDFECDAPFGYSNYFSSNFDLTSNPSGGTIATIYNNGDLPSHPIFKFKKIGNGDITIFNQSDFQDNFVFSGVVDSQVIQLDCENELLQSEMSATLTFTGSVNNGETVVTGSRTYQYSTTGSVTNGNILVDVSGGTGYANAVNQLVSAINSDPYAVVTALAGTGTSSVIITTKETGNPNGNIALSKTCANASWNITTLDNTYQSSKWNGNIIEFALGRNDLNITGNCQITITHRDILF